MPVAIEQKTSELEDFYQELNRECPLDDYECLNQRFQKFRERGSWLGRLPRKLKRKSFDAVDRFLVQMGVTTPGVRILGICPRTIDERFVPVMDRIGGAVEETDVIRSKETFTGEGEAGVPKFFKLSSAGEITQEQQFRKDYSVILQAMHSDREASWEFMKPWLHAGAPTTVVFVCIADKTVPVENRHILCKAIAYNRERIVANSQARKVALPLS